MEVGRKLEVLGEQCWFVPEVPGKGRPIIQLSADPSRELILAFSTREKCEKAIEKFYLDLPGIRTSVVTNVIDFNDEMISKGFVVAIDLHDDGNGWRYSNFTRPMLSPGGEA